MDMEKLVSLCKSLADICFLSSGGRRGARPSPSNRMMAPAAINAAVNDALAPLGVRLTELPMTPERILAALRAAGSASDSAG